MVIRRASQLLVFQDFFFFLYFLTDNFVFSDCNTYLDAKIFIITLRFGGLEITLVLFSHLFTRFLLCLQFTFLSLTVARVAIFKTLFFASVQILRAETSDLNRAQLFHVV